MGRSNSWCSIPRQRVAACRSELHTLVAALDHVLDVMGEDLDVVSSQMAWTRCPATHVTTQDRQLSGVLVRVVSVAGMFGVGAFVIAVLVELVDQRSEDSDPPFGGSDIEPLVRMGWNCPFVPSVV